MQPVGFPGCSVVKNLTVNGGDAWVRKISLERK